MKQWFAVRFLRVDGVNKGQGDVGFGTKYGQRRKAPGRAPPGTRAGDARSLAGRRIWASATGPSGASSLAAQEPKAGQGVITLWPGQASPSSAPQTTKTSASVRPSDSAAESRGIVFNSRFFRPK